MQSCIFQYFLCFYIFAWQIDTLFKFILMICFMIYENTLLHDLASTFHIIKMHGYRFMFEKKHLILYSWTFRMKIIYYLIMINLGYIFHFIVCKEEINVSSRAVSHPSEVFPVTRMQAKRQNSSCIQHFIYLLLWNTICTNECCIMPPNRLFLAMVWLWLLFFIHQHFNFVGILTYKNFLD